MMIHRENAGGEKSAKYDKKPDKESPLWDIRSKIIYYRTADTSVKDETRAYIIVCHGGVFDKRKTDAQSYLSFRAVKDV